MRLIIIDNGLEFSFGHSYAIDRALQAELLARRIEHTFFVTSTVEPATRAQIDCVPHFAHPLYWYFPPTKWEKRRRRFAAAVKRKPEDDRPSERQTASKLNESFEGDLDRLPADVWDEGNFILITALMQHQLVGLANFLDRRGADKTARIVCQLMFKHDWLPWRADARLGTRLYRRAFRQLKPRIDRSVFFTTENPMMGAYFRTAFNVPTTILPVPLQGAAPLERAAGGIKLGFFGYSKPEKGFHLLPKAIAICQAARSDLDFTIQIQHYDEEPSVVEAAAALERMKRMSLLDMVLSEEEFAAQTGAMDIVLLPYDPQQFGMRGSGLFTESVSAGRLIVASQGTWAARSIEQGEAVGVTFAPYTSEALAQAILSLCADVPAKSRLAREKAQAFAADHSIAAYVDALLAIAGRA